MGSYQISTNIYVGKDPKFGEYDKEIVHRLLQQVQIDFSCWIGDDVFQTCNCTLLYKGECPTIYKVGDKDHLIMLHVTGNEWWRWIYQFAHEYCHHLVNGPITSEMIGLQWFEEVICDLSSICHLDRLIALCDVLRISSALDNHNRIPYKIPVIACRNANLGTAQENCSEYLKSVAEKLAEPVCHRDIYSNLSATMLPLFQENPRLWKIILHFGDMRRWSSLEDLFDHLETTATVDYAASLTKLRSLLFS